MSKRVNIYIRFSTDKQDEQQQLNTVNRYLTAHGMVADNVVRDEGVSGGKSYKERNLNALVTELNEGDTLVVSELSRLTRGGIIELADMIENFFKPRRVRLIVVNVGLDIDCSNITAMVELQLAMLASFAKIEKECICQRTQSAIDVRKRKIAEEGSFVSKRGNVCTHLGRQKGCDLQAAQDASAIARRKRAQENPNNKMAWGYLTDYNNRLGRELKTAEEFAEVCDTLNRMGVKTATGMEYTVARMRATYYKLKKLYAA